MIFTPHPFPLPEGERIKVSGIFHRSWVTKRSREVTLKINFPLIFPLPEGERIKVRGKLQRT